MADEDVDVTAERVSRRRRDWSTTVERYLEHLATAGIGGLPRPLVPVQDDREDVTFVEGGSMVDAVLGREHLAALGRLLRAVHDAGASFASDPSDVWQPFEFRAGKAPTSAAGTMPSTTTTTATTGFLDEVVVGHGDTGPWNLIATTAASVSLIDWEFSGPIARIDEISATCWLDVRFHDPAVDLLSGATDLDKKIDLLAVFLDAYGLPRDSWTLVVRGMIDYAIRDTAYEATRLDVVPGRVPNDESTAWRLAWRSRSAAWIVRHQNRIAAGLLEGRPSGSP